LWLNATPRAVKKVLASGVKFNEIKDKSAFQCHETAIAISVRDNPSLQSFIDQYPEYSVVISVFLGGAYPRP